MKLICKIFLAALFGIHMTTLIGCSAKHQAPNATTQSSKATQKSLAHLNRFEALGKIGFSDGEKGGNASVRWEQNNGDYRIHLYGPLGSGSLQIAGQSGSVRLISSDGQTATAKTPEELVSKELGWVIPVSGLRYWLRGMAMPGIPPEKMLYNQEELKTLVQQGWTVHFQEYQDINGLRLPYKLTLKNGSIRLKFIFNDWQFS